MSAIASDSGRIIATGSWSRANRKVTPSDAQVCASPSIVCQLWSPTNASGSSCARLTFVNVKPSEAIIGASVNTKKPMSHGEMNR